MDNEPFRILILGDFGARDHRGLSDPDSLGARRPRRVDRDDLDAAIAALAPELRVSIDPSGPPIAVGVTELDDFHPDHLVERVADFQRLRDLRAQIANQRQAPSSRSGGAAPSASAAAVNLSQGSVLDMILAGEPGAPVAPVARPRDELSDFVNKAVQPHVVAEPSVDQQTLIQNIDDVIAATMRVLLHHPSVQAAESAWRGVSFLVRRLDTNDSLQIYVADVTKGEVTAAVAAPDSAGGRALRKLLRGEERPGRWALAVGLYAFTPGETPLLASIAALGRETGVPWMGAASASFAGIASFAESADPDDWDQSPLPDWDAFRRTPDARWISLTAPRFLLRVPYGKRSDDCSVLSFEETDGGQIEHSQYLWGNGALLGALLFGEAIASDDELPTHGVVTGLPMFVATVDGLAEVAPCAEALLGQRAVSRLLDRGLTALASERDGDSVRLPRVQSVSMPPAPLAQSAAAGGR